MTGLLLLKTIEGLPATGASVEVAIPKGVTKRYTASGKGQVKLPDLGIGYAGRSVSVKTTLGKSRAYYLWRVGMLGNFRPRKLTLTLVEDGIPTKLLTRNIGLKLKRMIPVPLRTPLGRIATVVVALVGVGVVAVYSPGTLVSISEGSKQCLRKVSGKR